MPFEIRKKGDKYRLYNLEKRRYAKATFNSRESAKRQASNWMRRERYRSKKT